MANGNTWLATSSPRPATEPTAQKRYPSKVSASSSTIADVTAPNIAATAAPVKANPTGVAPLPREANRCTPKVAANAPANAHHTADPTDSTTPTCSPSTTATAAPALTPKIPGSARALRVCPCISAPATPRHAPINNATTALGNRRLRTITSASVPAGSTNARTTAPGPTHRVPKTKLAPNATPTTNTSPTNATGLDTPRTGLMPEDLR
ncbi:hypothetical protein GCM10009744_55680 [Kribbella alba]|uniref:Uncharacterized protein n=1 Tax=Kribbella alba TaxID=190197 RepID=A0ABN2FQV1_9ACTN